MLSLLSFLMTELTRRASPICELGGDKKVRCLVLGGTDFGADPVSSPNRPRELPSSSKRVWLFVVRRTKEDRDAVRPKMSCRSSVTRNHHSAREAELRALVEVPRVSRTLRPCRPQGTASGLPPPATLNSQSRRPLRRAPRVRQCMGPYRWRSGTIEFAEIIVASRRSIAASQSLKHVDARVPLSALSLRPHSRERWPTCIKS